MTIAVHMPLSRQNERNYIASVIFNEFLGIDYELILEKRQDILLVLQGSTDKRLLINDTLLSLPEDIWLTKQSLPKGPLPIWNASEVGRNITLVATDIPIIYGKHLAEGGFYAEGPDDITLGIDIFGSAFFMLTRYEEVVSQERDKHDRFPASASLAYNEGFLERPIVNEYVNIFWACLERLWPGLKRKQRSFEVRLSHDVDVPFCASGQPVATVGRAIIGDVIKRQVPGLAYRRAQALVKGWMNDNQADPCNTFDWLMTVSESHGIKSAFYFIAGDSGGDIKRYQLHHPWIRQLLKHIADRGHEIGLHPSYNTFRSAEKIQQEFSTLQNICNQEGIFQALWGGRQHFLRWEAPATWRYWEAAGLNYDSTVGFADRVGFRCGTCFEYTVYDLLQRRQLALKELPLIVMEGTLLTEQYMNLNFQEALEQSAKVKAACKVVGGIYTLLWHNSFLLHRESRDTLIKMLEI